MSLLFVFTCSFTHSQSKADLSYFEYHAETIRAEQFIADEKFGEALSVYDTLFDNYSFVFLRDIKIAAQIAMYTNELDKGIRYVRRGISEGWSLKSINGTPNISKLKDHPYWNETIEQYENDRVIYESGLNKSLREQVRKMFKKDQKKAMGAMIRVGGMVQVNYNLSRFAPHSEQQMKKLIQILDVHGYPGEKLIANNYWMSTIISHHNSISAEYSRKDTLFPFVRPLLMEAIDRGEMSPYEFALIEDWRITVISDGTDIGYGFLDSPFSSGISETNELRTSVGLRPVELRNALVEIENKTGMNFLLPDWINGKIDIEQ